MADVNNHAVKKIVPGGTVTTITVTTIGSGFNFPTGVAVDASGNVYVVDQGNNTVKKLMPLP